jgi:transcriptional regulator with XRE-family HTH domain
MDDHHYSDDDLHQIGQKVREEIARRRISRPALAEMAKVSLSTLEKALAGTRPFTLHTIIRIEEAFKISLRPDAQPTPAPHHAPDYMGAYSRSAVQWIEGRYLALRPSFGTPGDIFSYIITIRWISETGYLGFEESERADGRFEQAGHVSMPHLSGHIYLVTNDSGQYRMILLGRPTIDGHMFGILTTLQVGHGSQLVPVATPIALVKTDTVTDPALGIVSTENPHHGRYKVLLDTITAGDFARFPVQVQAMPGIIQGEIINR